MGLRRVLDHSVKEARQLLHTGQRRLIHLLLERLRNRIAQDQFLGRAEPLSLHHSNSYRERDTRARAHARAHTHAALAGWLESPQGRCSLRLYLFTPNPQ